jgi:N12 class adenine-specific DNA methylase
MARLRKSDPETVLKGVLDRVVENPETGFLETMDEYLSGNVRRKLELARQMAESNPEYGRNVKLLEAAQPPEIPAHRITARIGASWIHPDHLAAYVREKMQLTGLYPVFNFNPVSNEWSMSFSRRPGRWKEGVRVENKAQTERDLRAAEKSVEATRVWGTPYRNFFELMKDAIEGRRPLVTYYDRDLKKTVIDPVATKGAEAKLQDIQRDFQRWLFAEPTRADEAVARFNQKINTSIPLNPDGSHLTFPGKSLALLTAKEAEEIGVERNPVTLYPHQPNAVWKYLRTGNLYVAHEMGAGKTVTFAMIAMEARRLRGKKKVLYVTHSDSTMDQGIAEIKKIYPLANVLPVRVSTNEERKQHALQKIALNDFDIAVMRQQDLDRIALSPDAERVFIQDDLNELREVLEYGKASGERIQERDIQTRITALEEKLKETVHEEAKRKNLFFDDLGIDLLITDEVHSYKNVPFATRLHGITGLNPAGSQTAMSFLRKTQYLNAAFPKRDAVVVGSGTPLTNSIAELYNLQKFLQPNEMKRQGVWNFDRWIANYGEIGTELEWDGARQEHKPVTTNRRIVNAGRLLATVFQNLSSVLADDTPIKRPKIRGGEPQRVKIKPNQYVEEYKEIVRRRVENIENDARHAMFQGVPDNMLRVISNMSKVAIDQRLDRRYANTPMMQDSKIYQSARIIARRWKEEAQHKGVQLVFADLGIPHRFAGKFKYKTQEQLEKLTPEEVKEYNDEKFEFENQTSGFNTYDALKAELIKLGVPAQEIAFIHDADAADKDKKKANLRALFNKVNDGEIRVLIGSTSKAGTGVNVQARVSDVHHLDVWWNYSSWAQRNGRGRRAGNLYTDLDGVYIWNYVTETTVDATRWDKVYAKGRVLNSVLSGDINLDVIEDISEETMSAKMMAAEASGDPLMAQHAQAMNRVQNLRLEQSSYLDNVRSSRMELSRIPGQISGYQNGIEESKKSREVMEKVTAVQFTGDKRILVLEKHGKEIAAALEAAVTKAVESDPLGDKPANLFVLGSHEEAEDKEMVEGKEKKVKKYTFIPLPVKGSMPPASEARPYDRKLTLSGRILASERDLATVRFSFPKGKKKGEPPTFAGLEIGANVSRSVTEYVSRRKGDEEYYAGQIAELKAKEPKLKKVAETPWEKQGEFEEKVKELADIERQMAERGQAAGRPEEGFPISNWEAPVPTLEDVAEKDKWTYYPIRAAAQQPPRLAYYPQSRSSAIPFGFIKEGADLKDFARNRGKKFDVEMSHAYEAPEALDVLKGPPLSDQPKAAVVGYTTIENQTRFWARTPKGLVSLNPLHWDLLNRILGKEGSWHYVDSRMGGEFLVHVNPQGQRDAFIRVRPEDMANWPKAFREAEKPEAPEGGDISFSLGRPEAQAPPFYSALRKTVETKMGGSMPAKQLRALLKQPGIKQDEVNWTGIDAWLAGKEGKVTKEEVLAFLDFNEVKVSEVMRQGAPAVTLKPEEAQAILDATMAMEDQVQERILRSRLNRIALDQYETPYDELSQADQGLVQEIAAEPEEDLNRLYEDDVRGLIAKAEAGDDMAQDQLKSMLGKEHEELFAPFVKARRAIKPAKYEQYNLPGARNYRELLFTLPTPAEKPKSARHLELQHKKDIGDFTDEEDKELGDWIKKEGAVDDRRPAFTGGHFPEANVLAHVRFDERTDAQGKRLLFIEEIQSDWHQQGREKGYATPSPTIDDVEFRDPSPDTNNRYSAWLRGVWIAGGATPGDVRTNAIRALPEVLADERLHPGPPPAPFAKTWHEFVLKRMIRWAAENGYDSIAWTTGEQQADRYNLATAVNSIEWEKVDFDQEGEEPSVTLSIRPRDLDDMHAEDLYRGIQGRVRDVHWDNDPDAGPLLYVPAHKLADVLGKDLAKRILESKEETGNFEGEDLKIGGEGMKGFYDKIIPDYLNKFGKKWNAKVEDTHLQTGQESVYGGEQDLGILRTVGLSTEMMPVLTTVHSFPITPEMRRTAMEEGFPLFNPPGWERVEPKPQQKIPERELLAISALVNKMVGSKVVFQDVVQYNLEDPKVQSGLRKHGYSQAEIDARIARGDTALQVAGSMTPQLILPNQWKALIRVSLRGKEGPKVMMDAFHEAFEAARKLMLTEQEIKILDQKLPGREGIAASEIQSDAFADYMIGKRRGIIPQSVQTIFDKIQLLFERIRNFLNGLGFRTAEDIFESLAQGKILKRQGQEQTGPLRQAPALQVEDLNKIYRTLDRFREEVNEDIRTDRKIKADPYANIARAKAIDEVEKGLKSGQTPAQVFDRLKADAAEALKTSQGIGADSYDEVSRLKAIKQLERDLNRVWPFPTVPVATAFTLDPEARKNVDNLKAGASETEARAEQDSGFKKMISKTRLGLVKITDPDLKLWERALSLPFWLQNKYSELRPLVKTQMQREEKRSELIHSLLNRGQDFFTVKGESLLALEKAVVAGDRQGKVFEEKDLREKFKLDDEGVKGYKAVRKTLDWIHRQWKDKIQANFLREFEREKWFALFKAAHGIELSGDETSALAQALRKTYRASEKPIETVRKHLQKIFEEKLTQEDKRLLVKDYVEAYNKAKAQLNQIKAIVRDAIGEGMSEEELNKQTRALVLAYVRTEPAAKLLREMRDELNRLRGYFPRSRKQGKYRVVATDEWEDPLGNAEKVTVYYENAANRIEATRILNRLKRDPKYKDLEISVEPNRQEAETSFMGASAVNIQRLVDNAIDKLKAQGEVSPDIASQIRLNVLESLADELKARGAGRFAIQRAEHIIEGYQKTNLKEVLKDYIDGWSGMMTKQDAALEFLDELKEIPRSKPQLIAYGSKYAQDMLRNQEPMDRISGKMRSLAFIYFLGGSLRAALVNFTQNYVTGIPFLAREVGAKSLKAEKLYHKAMFDVAVGKGISEVEQKMLDEMLNKGIAEDQYIRQITREVKGAVGKTVGQVTDILSKPFSWMERLNRKAAALAMFRHKYASYLSATHTDTFSGEAYRKAFEDAQDFVYKTHYLMTKANLPSVAADGDVGAQFLKTAYTFRRFTHNYLLSLHNSLTGPEGKLALDVMGRSLAYIAILGGVPALPFLDDLLDLWEKFFGTPVRSSMRKTLREAGGPVLEKVGMVGIPALMGIDISGSLKTGVPGLGYGTPADTVYGVYGGLGKKALNAMNAAERDDYLRALEFASPSFLESILKAYRMADQGATTPSGKVLTDEQGKPIHLSGGEAAAQSMGFRPERMAQISGEHWTMENVKKHYAKKRNDLYARARLAKNQEERQNVIRDMQRFNMEARKYQGVIPPIAASSLRETTSQRPERPFMEFGKMMEAGQ